MGCVFAWRGYRNQRPLSVQKHHLHYSDCAISQGSCGRRIWDWYFSPKSSAIKQLPASPCTALSLFPFTTPSSRKCHFTRTDLNVTPGNKVNGKECTRNVCIFGRQRTFTQLISVIDTGIVTQKLSQLCHCFAPRLSARLLITSICKGQSQRTALKRKLTRDC